MDNLKNNIITLNNNQYFVIEETVFDYDVYDLILNVNNESDIKIMMQDIKNGKTVLREIDDNSKLEELANRFKTALNIN